MIINVENDEMLGRTNDKALHITLIEQQKEIERLKENNENMQIEMASCWEKIDKAIEYIEQHNLDRKPNTTTRLDAYTMQERKLLDILKGDSSDI